METRDMMRLRLNHRGLVLISVPLLIQVICVITLYMAFADARKQSLLIAKERDFILTAQRVEKTFFDAVYMVHFYFGSQGLLDKDYLTDALNRLHGEVEKLKGFSFGNPKKAALADRLAGCEDFIRRTQKDLEARNFEDVRALVDSQSFAFEELNEISDMHSAVETLVQSATLLDGPDMKLVERDRKHLGQAMIVAIAASFAAAGFVAWLYSSSIAGRLSALVAETDLLSMRKKLPPPLSGNDEIAEFDLLLREIDASLSMAERNESRLFHEAADLIVVLDRAFQIVRANPAAVRAIQPDGGELTGRNILEFVEQWQRDLVGRNLAEVAERAALDFEAVIETAERKKIEMMWSASWSAVNETIFCVIHDITEAKEVERLREQFIQTVSNDLTQPLVEIDYDITKILSAPDGGVPQGAVASLEQVKGNISHLSRLLNDLLDMESVRSGRINVVPEACNTSEILKRAYTAVSGLASSKTVEITCSFPSYEIRADRDRLVQVLVNLLSNAIKFSSERASVALMCTRDGNGLEFSVSDRGKGIPLDAQEKIFQPFERLKEDIGTREGAGLGLSICKLIVEAHGGQIGVESKVGRGSRFWFRLPLSHIDV